MTGSDSWPRRLTRLLPFPLRVEWHRLRRRLADAADPKPLASERGGVDDFPHRLAVAESPLERVSGAVEPALQLGKEINVALAARSIHRVVLGPGQRFSYHRLVGRPSRLRGFRRGLELHDGQPSAGVGGGLCQVSNLLYWLALKAGLTIVERHRHGFDLFPDQQRTVPFGCGATVYYNYRDLRFDNPLDQPVLVSLVLTEGPSGVGLAGALCTASDPGWRVELVERDHRFFEQDGQRMRENRIHRRIVDRNGQVIEDRELAHNLGQVMY